MDNLNALKILESKLIKNYGENYQGITQKIKKNEIEFLETEFPSINYILGGGLPLGKLIEIHGKPSSGKSTISYQLIASVQKQNKLCCLIDAENAFDINYAKALGIDTENLAIFSPDDAESAIDLIREIVREKIFTLIVIDSIAALSPKEDIQKSASEYSMAVLPRLLSRTLKDICHSASKNKCSIIAINQLRDNLSPYGTPEISPGGNALKFHASIIVKVTKKEIIKDKSESIGIISEIKTSKNKVSVPFKSKLISILYPYEKNKIIKAGIDPINEQISYALDLELIQKKGPWFYWGEEKFQGLTNCIEYFSIPENYNLLTTKIKSITNG